MRVQAYDYKDRCAHTFFVRKQQKLSTVVSYMGILRAGWNKLKHIVLPNPRIEMPVAPEDHYDLTVTISSDTKPASAIDLSNYDIIRLVFYVDPASCDGVTDLCIRFFSAAACWTCTVNLSGDAALTPWKQGRNICCLYKGQFTADTGSVDWSNITAVRIVADTAAQTLRAVRVLELAGIRNRLKRGVVILSFDDGNDTDYTQAKRILDKFNYGACSFVNGTSIGLNDHMSKAQLRALQDISGWDIGSHGLEHIDFSISSDGAIEKELRHNIEYLSGMGIPCPFFAYPHGKYSLSAEKIVKRYHSIARLAYTAGYESYPLADNHRIKAFAVEGSTSLAAVEGCIDNISNWRGVGVFFFHRLVADNPGIYNWRIPDFQSLVEHIAAKNVDVFTFTQFFKKYCM